MTRDLLQPAEGTPSSLRWVLALALAAAACALYMPSLSGELVYDDLLLVERSPATRSIGAALAHSLQPFYAFDQADSVIQRGLWRPMTSLLLAIGRTLAGGDPAGFHGVSLLLHVAATLTAFRLAALLLRTRARLTAPRSELGGAVCALLFAFHPAQVESVAWISAVNDPAWSLFALLALLAWERAALQGRASAAAGVWTLLALLSKEQAVVLPALLLLLDLSAGRGLRVRSRAAVVVAVPLVLWYGARAYVFGEAGAGLLREHGDFGLSAARDATFRLELLGGFVRHVFWPTDPAVFRPVHPVLPEGSSALTVGVVGTALALVALLVAWVAKRRVASFGLATLLLVVLPIALAPDRAGLFPLSDRYMYLAVFAGALAITGTLAGLRSPVPLAAFGLLAAALMAPVSLSHQRTFSSELAFRDGGVEDAPDSPNVRWGAGRAYLNEFLRTQNTEMLAQSYLHYLHSLKAVTLYGDGSFVDDESLPVAERAARLEALILNTPPEQRRPNPTVFATLDDRFQATQGQIAVNLLGVDVSSDPDLDYPLLLAKGAQAIPEWADRHELNSLVAQIHLRRGELQEAKTAIAEAMRKAPSNAGYKQQLAEMLLREGDFEGARTTMQRALELAPDDLEARFLLARAALDGGRLEIAAQQIDELLQRTGGDDARALVLRGGLELRKKRPLEAQRYLDRALEIDRGNGEAHKQRGLASLMLGDTDGALAGFGEAASLMPEDFTSHYNVAALLLQQPPAEGASEFDVRTWEAAVRPPLMRALALSPPQGQEQLLLSQQLEGLIGESPDWALNVATFLHEQKRLSLALPWVTRATRFGDRWPEAKRDENLTLAYTLQGQMYRNLGRPFDSLAALEAAISFGPDHFPARFELADLLFGLERFEEAKVQVDRALELLPQSSVIPAMRMAVRDTLRRWQSTIDQRLGGD